MYVDKKSYNLDEYINRHGDGSNRYRSETFAQPRTLVDGDILSNGWQVRGDTFTGYNSSVGINFTNGVSRIVAPRLPLQLMTDASQGVSPERLRVGRILQTGCVMLDNPKPLGAVACHQNQVEIALRLTGGRTGHTVGVPIELELAVYEEEYPPNIERPLGAFSLGQVLNMDESARNHLPPLF